MPVLEALTWLARRISIANQAPCCDKWIFAKCRWSAILCCFETASAALVWDVQFGAERVLIIMCWSHQLVAILCRFAVLAACGLCAISCPGIDDFTFPALFARRAKAYLEKYPDTQPSKERIGLGFLFGKHVYLCWLPSRHQIRNQHSANMSRFTNQIWLAKASLPLSVSPLVLAAFCCSLLKMVPGICSEKRHTHTHTQARKALHASRGYQTVDERNPAPTEMYETLCNMGFLQQSVCQYVLSS